MRPGMFPILLLLASSQLACGLRPAFWGAEVADDESALSGEWRFSDDDTAAQEDDLHCLSDSDCPPGHLCAPWDLCLEAVPDCPLSEECLADPAQLTIPGWEEMPGFAGTPAGWQGTDPLYSGSFNLRGATARIAVDFEFYDDHVYGEGLVAIPESHGRSERMPLVFTGLREGRTWWGQIFDPRAVDRDFDAVYSGTLRSGSEIRIDYEVSFDGGGYQGEIDLLRISPCGCDTEWFKECEEDPYRSVQPGDSCESICDCAYLEGERCADGMCVTG